MLVRVKHPKLYMRVNGKVQKVEVGDEIEVNSSQMERFADKVEEVKQKKAASDKKG